MFSGCSLLTSLILSNFDTSLVTTMASMFNGCSSLKQLDLSSFRIPLVKSFYSIFDKCNKLQYVNLNNSYSFVNITVTNMFNANPINMAICINPINNTRINNSIYKIKCAIIDCTEDWKIHQKKIVFGTEICVDDCSETENNKYEYDNICYETYPEGTYPHKNFLCELFPETENILESEKSSHEKEVTSNENSKGNTGDDVNGNTNGNTDDNNHSDNANTDDNNNINTDDNNNINTDDNNNSDNTDNNSDNTDDNIVDNINSNISSNTNDNTNDNFNDNINDNTNGNANDNSVVNSDYRNNIAINTNSENTQSEDIKTKTNKATIETNTNNNLIITNENTISTIETTTYNILNINKHTSINIITNPQISDGTNQLLNYYTTYIHSSYITQTIKEYIYDNSNLFHELNNTEKYTQLHNYLSNNYSTLSSPNIVFKSESDFIYQITTSKKEKALTKQNFSEIDYNISIIDFSECEQLLKKEYHFDHRLI